MKISKCISTALAIIILATNINCAIANAEESTGSNANLTKEEKIEYIVSLGAPEESINQLPDQKINSMYNILSSKNYQFNSHYTKTQTMETNLPSTRSQIPSSKLRLDIYVFDYVVNNKVENVFVSLSFEWLSQPLVSMTDALTFNWDGSLLSLSGFYSSAGLTTSNGYTQSDYVTTPAKATQGGIGWFLNISVVDGSTHLTPPSGGAELLFVPRTEIDINTPLASQLNFGYAHQLIGFSISFGVSESGMSGSVSFEDGVYDEMAKTAVYTPGEQQI